MEVGADGMKVCIGGEVENDIGPLELGSWAWLSFRNSRAEPSLRVQFGPTNSTIDIILPLYHTAFIYCGGINGLYVIA